MIRPAPLALLVLVTLLLLGYGTYSWSWLAGPIAAIAVWGLDHKTHEPAASAPAHLRGEPASVD